jgi:hypothetical protein
MVAEPNLALIDHVNGATDAAAQIDRARWTFVVLQQGPTSSAGPPTPVPADTTVVSSGGGPC